MEAITKKFKDIGARVKIFDLQNTRNRRVEDISVNILSDRKGEYFDITLEDPDNIELQILDTQKDDKHLLLMAKTNAAHDNKKKFLCGYDERHFFSCAIPETAGVSTVLGAKQALKPNDLIDHEKRGKIKTKNLHKRKRTIKGGKIFRQGEFNFIRDENFQPPKGSLTVIHKNEPMSRGGGKPHMAEYLFRRGGTQVYVSGRHPNGLTEKEYKEFLKENPDAKKWNWSSRVRNPKVYAKGKISHLDHKTLNLGDVWHEVVLNTEDRARARRNVAFLD